MVSSLLGKVINSKVSPKYPPNSTVDPSTNKFPLTTTFVEQSPPVAISIPPLNIWSLEPK